MQFELILTIKNKFNLSIICRPVHQYGKKVSHMEEIKYKIEEFTITYFR